MTASRLLLCCADPREAALLTAAGHGEIRVLGVGKAAAAASLARALALAPDTTCVLLFGVCGAYPAPVEPPALSVLDLCVVAESVYADEGAATDDGFLDLDALGLHPSGPFRADPVLGPRVAQGLGVPLVRAATVSTCAGTARLSDAFAARSRAHVETMESAACALACETAGVPFVEVRCVSNRTGPRADGGFRIREACERAQAAVRRILDGGWLGP
ncbi:MAG: futalosine hydrolase [Planctomycetota bacterium]